MAQNLLNYLYETHSKFIHYNQEQITEQFSYWNKVILCKKPEGQMFSNITNQELEQIIEFIFLNVSPETVDILGVLILIFGVVVQFKIQELLLQSQLERIFKENQNNLQKSIYFSYLQQLKLHLLFEDCYLYDQIEEMQFCIQLIPQYFDRKLVELKLKIKKFKQEKNEEEFNIIVELYNTLKKYVLTQSQLYYVEQIEQFINFEYQQELKLIQIQELNQYYDKTFQGISVVNSLDKLLQRESFIENEVIYVQESQTLEYKDIYNLNDYREFIVRKAVTAFMNSTGGTLFIGIQDNLIVKGFRMQDKSENEVIDILEQILSKIHPKLEKNNQFLIKLFPIYDIQGNLKQGLTIIRINLFRSKDNYNLYTFTQYINEVQADATFCFSRYEDSSKSVKNKQLKQMIINANNNRDLKQKEYQQIIPIKPYSSPELNIIQEKEDQKYLIIRKITKMDYNDFANIIQSIQATTNMIKTKHLIKSSIFIEFNDFQKNLFLERLKSELIGKDIEFEYGDPHIVYLEKLSDENISKINLDIQKTLHLHNFEIIKKNQVLQLECRHIQDKIQIYKYLKIEQNLKIHWRPKVKLIYP